MDVTEEILYNHLIYGASDNTAPQGLSSSRALNYAAGPSITRPDKVNVSLIPYNLKYKGSVGLFGTENYFVKVTLALNPNVVFKCYEEVFWECARILNKEEEELSAKKGDKVIAFDDEAPIDTVLGVDIFPVVHRKTKEKIYVSLEDLNQ